MADINIEKKSAKWPWVLLGVLVLLAILYFVFNEDDADSVQMANNNQMTEQVDDKDNENLIGTDENVAAVDSLVSLVGAGEGEMGIDHEYTHRVLTQLVDATQGLADAIDFNIDAEMAQANAMADSVQQDPYEEDHANQIARAFTPITTALENIQEAHYPTLSADINALRQTSDSLSTGDLTLNQKDVVTSYFQKSAAILNKMN